ncbi:MAG: acylphosphatase [Candidatus Sumerlaeia bacterium]|jgi:acylphosphatase|nr:acylphosphatase [Candidatus Sumerlaeia bacterium]
MTQNSRKNNNQNDSNVLHAIVKGRVQGVGYRVFVRQVAMDLGCTGWVRNLPDKTVEVYAESDSEVILTDLLTEMYKGPVSSRVVDIQVEWLQAEHKHQEESFRILR